MCESYYSVKIKDARTIDFLENNKYNQVYKSFTDVIQIACEAGYSVELKDDGSLECWE